MALEDSLSNIMKTLRTLQKEDRGSRAPLLTLRLVALMMMIALLTMHLRSLKIFRWENSVSGGLLVTYSIAVLGLSLCAGAHTCGGLALQAYLSGTGAVLMAINAAVIWRRWRAAGELTRVVAELLTTLGVKLKRQVITKVVLSAAVSATFLVDMILAPILLPKPLLPSNM